MLWKIYKIGAASDDVVNMGFIAPHASEVIKIEKLSDKPVIVASDNNYTMGAECHRLAIEGDELIIEVQNLLPVDINYKVLLPEKYTCNGNRIVDVCLAAENPEAETISIKTRLS